jgi:hypothetical protein
MCRDPKTAPKNEERSERRRYYLLEMFTRPASRSRLMPSAAVLLALATMASLPGCMTEAWDGYQVHIITDEIPFRGFHPNKFEEITVEAWDYQQRTWTPVGEAVAEEAVDFDDLVLYRWKTAATLDKIGEYNHPVFWSESGLCKGRKARVRAVETDTGQVLASSREDGENCALENPLLKDWQKNCLAENSPVAEIFTADAAPLPAVDFDIHWLNPSGGCERISIQATGFDTAFEGAQVLASVSANTPGATPVWYECDPLTPWWAGGFMTFCEPPDQWPYNDPAWMSDNQDKIWVEYKIGFECNYGSIRYSSTAPRPIWQHETLCGKGGDPGDSPPPPPSTKSGTVWNYTCHCETLRCEDKDNDGICDDPQQPLPYEYFDLHTSTCFTTPSGVVPGGIAAMCTYAASWLEYGYALQSTHCFLDYSSPTQAGSCSGPYGTFLTRSVTFE